jgi:cell division protease FtsH
MNQIESTIIYIKSDDIQERGQIADLYEIARQVAPTIMVVEDIDTLGGIDRNRAGGDHPILGEFLNCLAGVESNGGVVTIATTNYPEHLDKALVDRPGRFDFRIDFGLPDDKLRKWILKKYLSTFDHQKIDFKALVKDTKGMTGAHLKEMVMMAYMNALEASNYNKKTKITYSHLEKSMKTIVANRAKYNHYNSKDSHSSILHG